MCLHVYMHVHVHVHTTHVHDVYVLVSVTTPTTTTTTTTPTPTACSTTQLYMEHWLRTMLEWDPKKRGGPMTAPDGKTGRVSCFEILSKILQTRVRRPQL